MRCSDVQALLPRMGADEGPVDLSAQRHIESCLACQAEVTRYQRMLRALEAMRTVAFAPPDGLLADTLAAVGGPSVIRQVNARRRAAVAGAIGAVAAGAAATAVVFARRRGLRLAGALAR